MQNIELKAYYEDFDFARQRLEALGARYREIVHQRDVYFASPNGRFKLRITNNRIGELIFYRRPDGHEPTVSDYLIYLCSDPDRLEPLLRAALEVLVVVEKQRELYLLENIRIHLDEVRGLGRFLELEAVITPGSDYEQQLSRVKQLIEHLRISANQRVAVSYSDLLRSRKAAS